MALKTANKGVQTLILYLQSLMDRVVSRQRREKIYSQILSFARDSPLYFTFLALQLLLAIIPVLLFASFATTILLLSFSTAILFSLFWIGVAFSLLIPALFFSILLAAFFFSWAASTILISKWIYGFVPANAKSMVVVKSQGKGNGGVVEKQEEDLTVDTKTFDGNDVHEITSSHTNGVLGL